MSSSFILEIDSVLDDKEYEKGILESNKFYEIKCDGNENDEDAECTLELLPEFSGKVPSKKWLDSHKVIIFIWKFLSIEVLKNLNIRYIQ